ncbi:hypothetical protein DPMN_077007 [Dreissena polymorpha]|uniref:HTH psq-type domain-containing protein n=1 Tax=Dreissena polymorpha TaxID=45954 RepID=A0A9D3YN37_DREPO|nr:hypothetical protein DPMN_077007 [Dreissena polymorpha]
MATALEMMRSGNMGWKAAAKAYGVQRITLLDKLSGRVPEGPTHVGQKTVLTNDQEEHIVK